MRRWLVGRDLYCGDGGGRGVAGELEEALVVGEGDGGEDVVSGERVARASQAQRK